MIDVTPFQDFFKFGPYQFITYQLQIIDNLRMNESTRQCLSDLKDLMETRKRMEAEGLLDAKELRRKIIMEEQMKWEITQILRHTQKKEIERKEAEQKELGKLTYRLERKMREVKRLREEEEYRRQVDERYEQRMREEKRIKEEGMKKVQKEDEKILENKETEEDEVDKLEIEKMKL